LFALAFICFHAAEETVVGALHAKTFAESVSSFSGNGGLKRVVILATIMTCALIPYFAYTQLARAIGKDELHSILLSRTAATQARRSTAPPSND
jgi:hypothetical protein